MKETFQEDPKLEIARLKSEKEQLLLEVEHWRRRAEEAEETERIATKDPLTGLTNRRGFEEMLEKIRETTQKEEMREGVNKDELCILTLDLDNFKEINDAYGHPVGDDALRQVAQFLEQTFRRTDVVARFGGEEFVIAFQRTNGQKIFNKLWNEEHQRAALEIPVRINDEIISISLSGGITDLSPSESFGDAYTRADQALYKAKNSGKNRIIQWSAEINTS